MSELLPARIALSWRDDGNDGASAHLAGIGTLRVRPGPDGRPWLAGITFDDATCRPVVGAELADAQADALYAALELLEQLPARLAAIMVAAEGPGAR